MSTTGDVLLDEVGEIYDKYRYATDEDELNKLVVELQAAINKYMFGGKHKRIDQVALDAHDLEYYAKYDNMPPQDSADNDQVTYEPVED